MFKKLLGRVGRDAGRDDAGTPDDGPSSESLADDAGGREWLAISFRIADTESRGRVRRFAEAVGDADQSETGAMFRGYGTCERGLVTLLARKGLAARLDLEARSIACMLVRETTPVLVQGDSICLTCKGEVGQIQQVVVTGEDGVPSCERIVVCDGDVLEREALALG